MYRHLIESPLLMTLGVYSEGGVCRSTFNFLKNSHTAFHGEVKGYGGLHRQSSSPGSSQEGRGTVLCPAGLSWSEVVCRDEDHEHGPGITQTLAHSSATWNQELVLRPWAALGGLSELVCAGAQPAPSLPRTRAAADFVESPSKVSQPDKTNAHKAGLQ